MFQVLMMVGDGACDGDVLVVQKLEDQKSVWSDWNPEACLWQFPLEPGRLGNMRLLPFCRMLPPPETDSPARHGTPPEPCFRFAAPCPKPAEVSVQQRLTIACDEEGDCQPSRVQHNTAGSIRHAVLAIHGVARFFLIYREPTKPRAKGLVCVHARSTPPEETGRQVTTTF
jgi:hypothetical protein